MADGVVNKGHWFSALAEDWVGRNNERKFCHAKGIAQSAGVSSFVQGMNLGQKKARRRGERLASYFEGQWGRGLQSCIELVLFEVHANWKVGKAHHKV